ncbi:hypothetical protein [Streptomyces sp. NPDC060031]|uniref:DUF7489 domain-containing protein n=1 Tax=Streptomyces sp. NPDC060031 TaxID=3347043 RepID=UPI00367B57B5
MWILFWVLCAWIVLALASAVAATARRESAETYEGVVVARGTRSVPLTVGSRSDLWLHVRDETGAETSYLVDGRTWAAFRVGDRIVKRAGERRPTRG